MPKQLEGSKPYHRKDGRWQSIYYENGSPTSVYAGTKLDCVDKVNAAVRARDKNERDTVVSKKVVLNAWIPQWLEIYKKGKLKESSFVYVENVLKSVMRSSIGKKEVAKISAIDIEKFLNGIAAPVMRQRTFVYLRECMEALTKNRTLKENVCDFVASPNKPASKEKIILESQEMETFFERLKIESPIFYLLARFLSSTGLRIGEALALTWPDIDFEKRTLSVTKAYDRVSMTVTTPKTKKSIRTIPLFDGAMEVLNSIKRSPKPIFSFIGKTASRGSFPDACIRCGHPGITFHTLRHVFTTRCLENGVDPKVIQKWLGHAKIDLSMNLYAHTNDDFEHTQMLKMAKSRC